MHELEAARHLRRMENVLILTHVRPDGDTVGCAAALCLALRKLGKTAYLLPNPGVTENTAPYVTPYEAPLDFQPEYIVSVDIATAQLLPENARMYAGQIELAIDHHPGDRGFPGEAGPGPVQHLHLRRHRQRQDHLPQRRLQLHPQG